MTIYNVLTSINLQVYYPLSKNFRHSPENVKYRQILAIIGKINEQQKLHIRIILLN